MQECPLCKFEAEIYTTGSLDRFFKVKCPACGMYSMSRTIERYLNSDPDLREKAHILSGYVRESSDNDRIVDINDETLEHIFNSAIVPKNIFESIDRIVLYLHKKSTAADRYVPLKNTDYPIAYAKNSDEFVYYWRKALELGYLEREKGKELFRLGLEGWKRADSISRGQIKSNQAFVAMSFAKALNEVWENGFKLAFVNTGYIPFRVDREEHNDKIDDRIIVEIRRSGLLVADFTYHRGGVYFEAGFALGLNIPVIWTCREDDLPKAHFDTRQYNHIAWKDPNDLRQKLHNRIVATLPSRGVRRFV